MPAFPTQYVANVTAVSAAGNSSLTMYVGASLRPALVFRQLFHRRFLTFSQTSPMATFVRTSPLATWRSSSSPPTVRSPPTRTCCARLPAICDAVASSGCRPCELGVFSSHDLTTSGFLCANIYAQHYACLPLLSRHRRPCHPHSRSRRLLSAFLQRSGQPLTLLALDSPIIAGNSNGLDSWTIDCGTTVTTYYWSGQVR